MKNNPIVIIGLGNYGIKFNQTRHNVGHRCIQYLVDNVISNTIVKNKGNSIIYSGNIEDVSVELLMYKQYMNTSGDAMLDLSKKTLESCTIFAICDELDLAVGKVKISYGRGSSGHNGIRSILHRIGNREIYRIKIGIDRPNDNTLVSDYVLKEFLLEENITIEKTIEFVCQNMCKIIKKEHQEAIRLYNNSVDLEKI